MNDLEKYFEKLQNSSQDKKRVIMLIGVPVAMALVIYVWLIFADFSFKENAVAEPKEEKISKLGVFNNGIKATLQELRSFIKNFKDKINQTNSFNIEIPESEKNLETTENTDNL